MQTADDSSAIQILGLIGQGSFGSVYKGVVRATGQIVAVKAIETGTGAGSTVAAVEREVAHLRKCASSDLIVSVLFVLPSPDGRGLLIVMEFCADGSVDKLARIAGGLSEDAIADIVLFVVRGLRYLHDEAHLIHRDIKAANLLITGGCVKIADLGVASQLASVLSLRKSVLGSPYHLAPEVLSAAPQYGPSVDIYSLGATCIEMAEGSPPLSHIAPLVALLLIAQDGARPSLTSPSCFSPSFGDFVGACLQREASLRPTAAELLQHPFLHAPQERIDSAGGVSLILAACVDDFAAEGLAASAAASAAELPWSPVQAYMPTATTLTPVLPSPSSTVIFSGVQGPAPLPPEYVLAALQVKTSAPATSAGSTGSSSGSGSGSGATQVSVYRLLADPGFVSRMRASEASQQLAVLDSVYSRDAEALRSEYAAARTLLESRLREL